MSQAAGLLTRVSDRLPDGREVHHRIIYNGTEIAHWPEDRPGPTHAQAEECRRVWLMTPGWGPLPAERVAALFPAAAMPPRHGTYIDDLEAIAAAIAGKA